MLQVPHKRRVEELSEFVVLVLQSGQFLLSLQQSVLQLEEGSNILMLKSKTFALEIKNVTVQVKKVDFTLNSSVLASYLFVSLEVRGELLRPHQTSRGRAVVNTLRL